MPKPTISSYLREHLDEVGSKKEPGPFLTISCQYGCDALLTAEQLLEELNERDEQKRWKLYHKDFLRRLADDTGLSEDVLEKESRTKPSLSKDFLRNIKGKGIPDAFEIHSKITIMQRAAAIDGHAVIILSPGQLTIADDLSNGLNVRIAAPREWRLSRICRLENLDKKTAALRLEQVEEEHRQIYSLFFRQNKREPAYHLLFDNSVFNNEQIARIVLLALEERKIISKPPLEQQQR